MTLKELRSLLGKNKEFDDYKVVFVGANEHYLEVFGVSEHQETKTFSIELYDLHSTIIPRS